MPEMILRTVVSQPTSPTITTRRHPNNAWILLFTESQIIVNQNKNDKVLLERVALASNDDDDDE